MPGMIRDKLWAWNQFMANMFIAMAFGMLQAIGIANMLNMFILMGAMYIIGNHKHPNVELGHVEAFNNFLLIKPDGYDLKRFLGSMILSFAGSFAGSIVINLLMDLPLGPRSNDLNGDNDELRCFLIFALIAQFCAHAQHYYINTRMEAGLEKSFAQAFSLTFSIMLTNIAIMGGFGGFSQDMGRWLGTLITHGTDAEGLYPGVQGSDIWILAAGTVAGFGAFFGINMVEGLLGGGGGGDAAKGGDAA